MDTILELMGRQQNLLETVLKLYECQLRDSGAIRNPRLVHAPTSKELAVLNAARPDASVHPEGVGSAEEISATAHPEGVGSDTQAHSQAMCRVEEIARNKNDDYEFREGEDGLSLSQAFEGVWRSGAVDGYPIKPSKYETEAVPERILDSSEGFQDLENGEFRSSKLASELAGGLVHDIQTQRPLPKPGWCASLDMAG
jgi:hypothetical protein